MINSWNLPWTSPFGERYRAVASVKSDMYYIDKYKALSDSDQTYTGDVARVFPQLGLEWKLPFVKATETSRQIIEPVIVGVLAPNGGNKTDKIPNEDSEAAELDDTNVLDLDRYAGYDRNDTGSRISYGLNWSSYGNIIGRTSAFIAQSYQVNDKTSFTENSENTGHLTDYVGRVYAAPADYLDLNYRFRLDRNDYRLKYSELGSRIGTYKRTNTHSIRSANVKNFTHRLIPPSPAIGRSAFITGRICPIMADRSSMAAI
jgi:LPS-assembly protein